MKTANIILLSFLALLFVQGMLNEPQFQYGLIVIGLMFMPVTFLTACYWKGKQATLQWILMASVFYNAEVAALLILHAATMNVTGSHPIALAVSELFQSLLLGVLAALNSWALEQRRRKISHTHDT